MKQLHDEMTVAELMGLLEEGPEDAVVRIVHQQSWPLQEVVSGIASGRELFADEPEDDVGAAETDRSPVVYLVANGHPRGETPYGSASAWNGMRRRWR